MRQLIFAPVVLAPLLSGCAGLEPTTISVSRIGSVVGDVKRQIAIYQTEAYYRHAHPDQDPARIQARAAGYKCGNGDVDFDIDTAAFDLLSTYDGTSAAGVTAGGSFGGGSVSASFSSSLENNNTQELKFNLYPLHNYSGSDELDKSSPAPIADVLLALRDALILSSSKPGICAYDYNFRSQKSAKPAGGDQASGGEPSASGNTFKIAVTITRDNKVSLAAGYSFISVLLSREDKTIEGNTITVTFVQQGLPSAGLPLDPVTRDPQIPHRADASGRGARRVGALGRGLIFGHLAKPIVLPGKKPGPDPNRGLLTTPLPDK